jgi:hypothetical protein
MRRLIRWLSQPIHLACILFALIPATYLIGFMLRYGSPFPIDDTVVHNLRLIVLPLEQGTFELGAISASNQGHRAVFTNLMTIFSYYALGWNVAFETGMLFVLAAVNVGLLLALFARTDREHLHWFIIPAAMLLFSTQHGVLFLAPRLSHWHYSLLFTLLTLTTLAYGRQGPRTVTIAAALAFAGTFTMGNGLLAWVVGFLAMIGLGYRDWRLYGLWIGLAVAATALYVLPGDFGGTDAIPGNDDMERVELASPGYIIRFVVTYLGAPLGWENVTAATVLGVTALVVLTLNSVYLWRVGMRDRLAIWLPLAAYGALTGVLLTVGRLGALFRAVFERTGLSATSFWACVVAVMMLATAHANKRGRHGLVNINSIVATVFVTAYLLTVYSTTNTYREGVPTAALLNHERCFMRYAFERTTDGEVCQFDILPAEIDLLAAYNLAGFRGASLPQRVPPTDHPLVIVTDAALHGVHIRDRMTANPDPILLFAESSDIAEAVFPTLDHPPTQWFSGEDERVLVDLVNAPSFTVIRDDRVDLWEHVATGLPPDYFVSGLRLVPDYHLTVADYTWVPSLNETDVTFNDEVRLEGWWIPSSLTVAPCESVTLQSVWSRVDDVPQDLTGIAFVMVDADGVAVARTEGESAVSSKQWEPDTRYLDQRSLTIPCETSPGSYPLMLGVYNFETTAAYGELTYLTNVVVGS